MKKTKIFSLNEARKKASNQDLRESLDPAERLEAELEFKTGKLLEALDGAYERIEALERKLKYLIEALKG